MRHAKTVILSQEEVTQLLQLARPGRNSLRQVERAKVVLLAAAGHTNEQIGAELGISRQTAARWRERFALERLAGINADRPGRGRKSRISPESRRAVVEKTGQPTPAGHARWSLRTMARATGLPVATVREIWRAHGLKPHTGRSRRRSALRAL
jgi:transposase